MTDRRIDSFFYGLFMDAELLRNNQVVPDKPRHAYVVGFRLCIGQRATLIPSCGARAYGMLFALTHFDLERLYSGPGLEHYRPEAVLARTLDGRICPALCYNLRVAPSDDERNPEYATRLQGVLRNLGFPAEYVASVS